MKIKIKKGEYTHEELLQMIEDNKKNDWQEDYINNFTPNEKYRIADRIRENNLLFADMFRFAVTRNGDWNSDYSNPEQTKWGIAINDNSLRVDYYYLSNCFVYGIDVKSKEIAEEMLQIFGDRIIEIYNKPYK